MKIGTDGEVLSDPSEVKIAPDGEAILPESNSPPKLPKDSTSTAAAAEHESALHDAVKKLHGKSGEAKAAAAAPAAQNLIPLTIPAGSLIEALEAVTAAGEPLIGTYWVTFADSGDLVQCWFLSDDDNSVNP